MLFFKNSALFIRSNKVVVDGMLLNNFTYRASDPLLFEGMVIDMFEALREMELDEFAQQLDVQLTDPEYAKR